MKLGIVGTGMVGGAAAYAIASTGAVSSLVLIDHDPELAAAQAADIAGEGATWFGVRAGLARMVRVIALDQHEVLTVCSMTPSVAGVEDVCLSLPRIVGARGIEDTLVPAMTKEETEALGASARMLRETMDELMAERARSDG